MRTTEIKSRLHDAIDQGDDELIRWLYDLLQQRTGHTPVYELTDEQKAELDRRQQLNEPTIPWEQAKQEILNKNKK